MVMKEVQAEIAVKAAKKVRGITIGLTERYGSMLQAEYQPRRIIVISHH